MALGHFALAWESQFYTGLALICWATASSCHNLPSQIGDLYRADDPRRGGAYNVYYVGVNLGGLLAPLVCGTLGEVYGWHWGFGAAGVGMCVGLIVYVLGMKHLPAAAPMKALAAAQAPRPRVTVSALLPLLLVGLAVMLFRSAYAQSGNTVALWVDRSVDLQLLGWQIPATWVQSLNPLFVFLFTPFLVARWKRAALRDAEPAPLSKMALGAAGVALAYGLLAVVAGQGGGVSAGWLLGFFVLYTLAELYILPVGLGLFARAAPPGMGATVIAAWFLAAFGGNLLSGVVGRWWEPLGPSGFFCPAGGSGRRGGAGAAGAAAAAAALRRLGSALAGRLGGRPGRRSCRLGRRAARDHGRGRCFRRFGMALHGLAEGVRHQLARALARRAGGDEAAGRVGALQVGVAHLRVEVDGVAGQEPHGRVQLGMELDLTLQHVRELFARVADEVAELGAELLHRARMRLGNHRREALVQQLGGQVDLAVAARLHDLAFAGALHDAAARAARRRAVAAARAARAGADVEQQLGHVHAQAAAQQHQLVVGERDIALLQLGQGGHRQPRAPAQLGQGQAQALAHAADVVSGGGVLAGHRLFFPVAVPRILCDQDC